MHPGPRALRTRQGDIMGLRFLFPLIPAPHGHLKAGPLFRAALLICGALLLLGGCSSTPPKAGIVDGGAIKGTYGARTLYEGESMPALEGRVQSSTMLRDGDGGLVVIPGVAHERPNSGYADARELKLKVRELAEQLVAEMRDCSLQGTVALPTAFVNLNNFDETSAFGRLMGEQLFYELNQRGYPVREYRLSSAIRLRKEGEFALDRAPRSVATGNAVIVVGTYSDAPEAIFVNARLVRPKDGRVLRTANLVLEKNSTVAKMMRSNKGYASSSSTAAALAQIGKCPMVIKDFDEATRPKAPTNLSPFDLGEDIH